MFDTGEAGDTIIGSGDPVTQIRMGTTQLAGEDRAGWLGTMVSERLLELLPSKNG
ncbi:MAG: hypothetical protein WBV06_07000 [Acidimicrobiia bacterium]